MNPGDNAMGIANLGWGVGKWTAVRAGGSAITNFCQLNCIPMGLYTLAALNSGDSAVEKKALPLAFLAAYAYVGFFV